jgi:hypothetical protein
MSETRKISEALIALGYSTGWVVSEAEITWIDEPEVRPTMEQIQAKIEEIESMPEGI